MQNVLVATDGSRGGNRAVIAAAQLAKATDATLLIVTISDKISSAELRRLARTEGGMGEALELISNQILDQAGGDTAEVIIEAVRREKADVVVVGRRGRGRLAGLLLGSVSQKIASLAPCIVMIVP